MTILMNSADPGPNTTLRAEDDTDVAIQTPAKVILFNDEAHTFEEVIGQIIKATGCDLARAEALTWEVHNTGKAMVFEGEVPRCVRVSSVLEEIDLVTHIEV
jgi:ATP-dependent Clp protease adaptor protein ClpS